MVARTHIVDGGGVSRLLKRLIVIDGGGVARELKRLFVIDGGGVARLIFQPVVINVEDALVSATSITPANAEAAYRLTNAGERHHGLNGSYTNQGAWIVPSGTEGDYDVQVDMVSGSLTTGTTGSRLALSSTRTWTLLRTTVGFVTCSFTVTIYRTADSAVMDVATVTLEAEEA